jgi:CAAX protease family protein
MMWGKLFGGPAAYVPQTGWPAWAVLPAAVVILVGPLLIGIAVMSAYSAATGAQVGDPQSPEAVMQFAAMFAGMQVGAALLTWVAAGFFRSERLEVLALRPPAQGWGVLPVAFVPLLLGTAAWTGVAVWWDSDLVLQDLRPFQQMLLSDAAWLYLLVICIGAPVSEELLFRGFIFSGLAKSRLRFVGTAVVTAVLWTALHANYSAFGLIEVFGIGLYFSWLLVRTGSLWVTIFCHAVYNTLIAAVLMAVTLPA